MGNAEAVEGANADGDAGAGAEAHADLGFGGKVGARVRAEDDV